MQYASALSFLQIFCTLHGSCLVILPEAVAIYSELGRKRGKYPVILILEVVDSFFCPKL